MITLVLVAMNLHEVLLAADGRLPRTPLKRMPLSRVVPSFINLTGMPGWAVQVGTFDTFYGVTIAYRLRTRVRRLADGYRWVHIDSAEVKSEDKNIIELVLETERP